MSTYWRVTDPDFCMACPVPRSAHGRRWTQGAGWHSWIRPTQIVIRCRMIVRRQEKVGRWIRWEDRDRMGYRKWKT